MRRTGSSTCRSRLSAPSPNTVSVNYSTLDSTAVASHSLQLDYVGATGTLNFAPGETTKVVRVQILDCPNVEGFEAFTFNLSAAVNGAISRASGRISIVDNDTIVATPRACSCATRSSTRRTAPRWSRSCSAAPAARPRTAPSPSTTRQQRDGDRRLRLQRGQRHAHLRAGRDRQDVVVPITDDATVERQEGFSLNLSNPGNATIADGTRRRLDRRERRRRQLAADDMLAPTDVILGEADGYVDLAVRLSAPGQNPVSVHYIDARQHRRRFSTACNSTTSAASGTLNFAPGETTKVVRVQILDCPTRRLRGVHLRPEHARQQHHREGERADQHRRQRHRGRDPALSARDAVVDEKDGFALVSVLLGGTGGQASNSTVTVDYATADGSATAGSDYTAAGGTLTFAPGETAKTVVVPIADDGAAEPAESFTLESQQPERCHDHRAARGRSRSARTTPLQSRSPESPRRLMSRWAKGTASSI